ncbi:MAG: hypothetical protein ABIO94_06985 [Opitutaceae bacterium]
MKNYIRYSFAALALASFAIPFHAAPITGAISLAGAVTPTGGNLNTATSFSTLGPGFATSTAGDFNTATSGIVTSSFFGASTFAMTPFGFGTTATPALSGGPLVVWTTTNAGVVTSFTLQSISLVDHNIVDQLGLLGAGFFSMTGKDNTPANFNLTANQAANTYSVSLSQAVSFANPNAPSAPDAGSTAFLLALVLGCLGFGVRRLRPVHSIG